MFNSALLHLTCEYNSILRLSAHGHANTVLVECYDDAARRSVPPKDLPFNGWPALVTLRSAPLLISPGDIVPF